MLTVPHPRSRNFMQRSYTVWPRVWAHAHRSTSKGDYTPIPFGVSDAASENHYPSTRLGE